MNSYHLSLIRADLIRQDNNKKLAFYFWFTRKQIRKITDRTKE